MKSAKNKEDDSALFLQAVEGVKRIGGAIGEGDVRHGQRDAGKQPVPAPGDDALFLQAMHKIGAVFRDDTPDANDEAAGYRSVSGRMRQLKRGSIRISRELDLHGFQKDEALARLAQFIAAASQQGQKAVLIITGKGINSPEGPVLQGAVADWLRIKGKGLVAEFFPAPRTLGGSGAFVVFLKKT